MIRRELTKEQIANEPWIEWNAFIELLTMEEYNDLTRNQQIASSLFWYDSEVQNGGHLQYFLNQGVKNVIATLSALESTENKEFYELLKLALSKYESLNLSGIEDIENYIEEALEDHFGEMDERYYSIEPTIQSILEEYLKKNKDQFIMIK